MVVRSEKLFGRAAQTMRAGLCAMATSLVFANPAAAQDQILRSSVQLKVGETRQIAVLGGHKFDCTIGTTPSAIQVVQPPKLGTLSRRENAPYVVQHSISGTCSGSRFLGTAIDYTARAQGSDTVLIDATFPNGQVHRAISITVGP